MGSLFSLVRYGLHKLFVKSHLAGIRKSTVDPSSKVESGSLFVNSTMARYSFCGYNCEIVNADIGSFCSIAHGVVIGGTAHPLEWISTSPVFYNNRDSVKKKFSRHEREGQPRTIVEYDVWIGRNALIKQGVTIGTGAAVGMGAIVTKDVPPYGIVGGNPARLIRLRFPDDLVSELVNSRWWLLPDDTLEKLAVDARSPKAFLNRLQALTPEVLP